MIGLAVNSFLSLSAVAAGVYPPCDPCDPCDPCGFIPSIRLEFQLFSSRNIFNWVEEGVGNGAVDGAAIY